MLMLAALNALPLLTVVALRAIVHVGPHKVGSTSLQATLEKGREALQRENFLLCPNHFPGGNWVGQKGCANVAFCLSGRSPRGINCSLVLRHFVQFLEVARQEGRGVVLSSEEFDHPAMNTSLLATALNAFDTKIVIFHRPFFEWIQSMYAEFRPRLTLEDFAAKSLLNAAAGRDRSSLSVYSRYARHFRSVTMRHLSGVITRFVCSDVRAKAFCRHLKRVPETHSNHKRVVFGNGCMSSDQKELMWSVSVVMEAEVKRLMAPGESSLSPNLTELRKRFVQAPYRLCQA